jgi:hypothetical protein
MEHFEPSPYQASLDIYQKYALTDHLQHIIFIEYLNRLNCYREWTHPAVTLYPHESVVLCRSSLSLELYARDLIHAWLHGRVRVSAYWNPPTALAAFVTWFSHKSYAHNVPTEVETYGQAERRYSVTWPDPDHEEMRKLRDEETDIRTSNLRWFQVDISEIIQSCRKSPTTSWPGVWGQFAIPHIYHHLHPGLLPYWTDGAVAGNAYSSKNID